MNTLSKVRSDKRVDDVKDTVTSGEEIASTQGRVASGLAKKPPRVPPSPPGPVSL